MLTVSLFAAVAVLAGNDPDGVVATAPATTVQLDATDMPEAASPAAAAQAAAPHGLTTDQQIARWIDDRSPGTLPFAESAGSGSVDDRQMHSQFSVGVGTGGYRDYGVAVSLPVGETGRLSLSYRQIENGYPVYGYGNGYSPGFGYGYGYGAGYGNGDPYFSDIGHAAPGKRIDGPTAIETRDRRSTPPWRHPDFSARPGRD
ncbi:hypothetical protein [uncultured Brevundimonas sp.]|uniref:hypothetical protein n=1 Tax=uncultured Brevundimonas sp. TaxID=213418 RepID=UPI0030EF515B|tara:strand:- start:26077 stop:26682 length:606 start_codon:yes stop_codon:yes gene_type:complete